MRLQEVLKEREAEITALEITLREKEQVDAALPPSEMIKGPEDHTTHLSPATIQKFNAIRKSMQLHGVSSTANDLNADADVDESLDRLNELMLYVSSLGDFWLPIFNKCVQGYGSEGIPAQ